MTPLIQRAVDKIVDNAREAADKDEVVDVKMSVTHYAA